MNAFSMDLWTKTISMRLSEWYVHQFKNCIAKNGHYRGWVNGLDPIVSKGLMLDLKKEEEFFAKAQSEILSKEEEQEMYEQFQSVMAISTKIETILKEIDYLEQQDWFVS